MSVPDVVADAHRREWAAVLAATVRVTRDLDLAEECVQDAFTRALESWPTRGVPNRPGAWLTTVATNRARDLLRRETLWRRTMPQLVMDEHEDRDEDRHEDRLRLIFTCCHPALAPEAQVALTLRLVCGLSTAEVARAFLVREATMAARVTRAKQKIAMARIPYRIPGPDDLDERTAAVREVLRLVFTTGHLAPYGEELVRHDLVELAIAQARTLLLLAPNDPDSTGLLALMLFAYARRTTRAGPDGRPQSLEEQDRSRWDQALIREAQDLVTSALTRAGGDSPSPYAVEAAIAAVHAGAPTWHETDWAEIVGLYDVLATLAPSPVVELNRAVAISFRDGPTSGLAALAPLLDEPALATYPYLQAARADMLRRLGHHREAAEGYAEASSLTGNEAEAAFLRARMDEENSC
jgi:RNA polymerase sigma-70 factor, ECF subfamily